MSTSVAKRHASVTRRHATTYYWSTMLLPRSMRPHVHALYAFCRTADDLVDEAVDPGTRAGTLAAFRARFFADLEHGGSDDTLLDAVVRTSHRFGIERSCFERFLDAMATDLTVTSYASWESLLGYMDGSAAAIGDAMLPILRPGAPQAAHQPARDLGLAFQVTNFLRDVGDDLDRGRVYLPQDDLARFGTEPSGERERVLAGRPVSAEWQALVRFEIERARGLYRAADAGIALLPGRVGRAIRSSSVLYERILDRIECQGYDVFTRRARVPTWRKVAAVARIGIVLR